MEFILAINVGSIFILIIFAALLLAATRFKGEYGYAAAIIVLTTVPVYLYNICRSEEWFAVAQWLVPIAFSVNTLLMPLLWLFVRHNFDKDFRFGWKQSLHFLPSLICFVAASAYLLSLQPTERIALIEFENSGKDSLIGIINSVIIFTQMFVYFTVIFVYLHRVKIYVSEHYSQADWNFKHWIPRYMILFASLFAVVFICYVIWPRTDTWLIQIINVLAMSYLVYGSLVGANAPRVANVSMKNVAEVKKDLFSSKGHVAAVPQTSDADALEQQRLRSFAAQVQIYLQESQAFLQPDLSLQDVARATGIAANNLSKAINSVTHRNFFELINKMRCEKAKELLKKYNESNLTMDAIAHQCGFNSRFTLNTSFKKFEGVSPSYWLKRCE